MINHYLELHEYINKNIYKFPVKEDDIILEGINWGSILKGGLALAGGIGLIILFKKFILPLLRRTKNLYKNSAKVLHAANRDKELKNKLQSSEDIQNCLKEFNSICHSNVTIDYFIDLTDIKDKHMSVIIKTLYECILMIFIQELYHLKNKNLNKEYIELFNNFLDTSQDLYKNSNDPYKWLDNIYKILFPIAYHCNYFNDLKDKTTEKIIESYELLFQQYVKDNNLPDEYTYKAEDILNISNITDVDLKEKYTKGFNKIHLFNTHIIVKLGKCNARLDQLIWQVGNDIKSDTKKNENKSDVSDAFKEAVKEKNLLRIHIMLKDNLLVDKSFKDFNNLINYAEKFIPNIWDEHNGEDFLKESEWTVQYLDRQMVKVIRNFSKERIELIKKMINKIYNKTNINGRPIPNKFKQEVTNRNILGIHIMLKNSLSVDKNFIQFDNMIKYALDNGINKNELYDTYDRKPFKSKDEWDKTYMNQQLVRLVDNFCIERITLLKEIINKLYNKK